MMSDIEHVFKFRTSQILFGRLKESMYWVSDSPSINFDHCLTELRDHQGICIGYRIELLRNFTLCISKFGIFLIKAVFIFLFLFS